MENSQYDLLEVLAHINPAELDYQDWLNVGMARSTKDTAQAYGTAGARGMPGVTMRENVKKSGGGSGGLPMNR